MAPMLYVPATFPVDKLSRLVGGMATFRGEGYPVVRLAIDTEDAVREDDLPKALSNIREVLASGESNFVADVFIRVRNLQVLKWLLQLESRYRKQLAGIVVPKADPRDFASYAGPAVSAGLRVLPILESRGMSRASFREALLDVFEPFRAEIDCVRMGGNDLLGCLSTRRDLTHGFTIHDQLDIIGTILTEFAFEGYAVTAAVFEGIDPEYDELFAKEVRQDIAKGMFGKTVICPRQLGHLAELYKVQVEDYESARQILDTSAPAVARLNGRMDEPTTHWRWAQRIIARADAFGVCQSATVNR
jgi:citrate lyase beta subunit